MRIEDYALLGDTHSAALVGVDGSVDWLCLPRFDSPACFAALLGDASNGRWRIAPVEPVTSARRRYLDGTLVLETELGTPSGVVRLRDFMPHRHGNPSLVRIVEGVSGRVPMRMELVVRFDYGSVVPWVTRCDDGVHAVAGPDALRLHAPVPTRGANLTTVADFAVSGGERLPFVLTWHRAADPDPESLDAERALRECVEQWRAWIGACSYDGPWRDEVLRSLLTLKALTYEPSGGMVAAPTTSLPERVGGVRNWDYRYCWLRDAAFTLTALLAGGHVDEASAWRDWLLRAVAGDPAQLQILYGVEGERRLPEVELDWLPGYEGSRPVRVGNAAARQLQLDVYGEVLDALHVGRASCLPPSREGWALQRSLAEFVETAWTAPDEGIWEVRGRAEHFTHSKVMAWVALDRAARAVEELGLEGPARRWRGMAAEIHRDVCAKAYDDEHGVFTRAYGSHALDASLLLLPLVGFLPGEDPRVRRTVRAVQQELCQDGLVLRYRTDDDDTDGLPPGEGSFLACSFWLVDALVATGQRRSARELFERLLALRNDVGLLGEEYDPVAGRMLGNFPQAFSHVGVVNSALALAQSGSRRDPASPPAA